MPRVRWRTRTRRSPLTPALALYLQTGDWQRALDEVRDGEAPDAFALYALAGEVIRGDVEPLRELWQAHGAEVLATSPGPDRPWALAQLEESGRARSRKEGDR